MVSQGTSSWMNNSQVCYFAGPNWLILQSDECQSWCKESCWGEECAVQTGVWRRAWRGSRMEENRLSPPVAASSFWFSSSLAKPLLTREREIRSQQCLDNWVTSTAAGGKLLKDLMASSFLQATMVRTQRELQERCQLGSLITRGKTKARSCNSN